MNGQIRRWQLQTLVAALLLISAGTALSDTIYTAVIDGQSANTPSPATGTAVLTLNDDQTEVTYEIVYSELLGVETTAHFHAAPRGKDGPILETLTIGSPMTGVWSVGPYEVGELNAGRIYINIHSDLYAIGEIRGFVEFSTVSDEDTPWSRVKVLYR